MPKTQVKTLMTHNPVGIAPDATLKDAAARMQEIGCGVLPVGTEEGIVGMITDRDIVVRAVAKGKNVATEYVESYMTPHVYYCQESDTVEEVANLMRDYRVTRLLVKGADGLISGIISFGCILRKDNDPKEISKVIECTTGKAA